MQQRQLRLGDILDDYCTRERRLTNHAVVAMVGDEVKQTRCTTCDTEHEYKHAKVPRQRRKADSPAALYSQVAANAPKRVVSSSSASISSSPDHAAQAEMKAGEPPDEQDDQDTVEPPAQLVVDEHPEVPQSVAGLDSQRDRGAESGAEDDDLGNREDEGPVHRPLIRASLPRDGQAPPARPIPEFTIRHPAGGRPARFRPRHPRGGSPFQSERSSGNGFGGPRNAGQRHGGGRPPQGSMTPRQGRRHGPGRKRSK
jgi:hypothetical protein